MFIINMPAFDERCLLELDLVAVHSRPKLVLRRVVRLYGPPVQHVHHGRLRRDGLGMARASWSGLIRIVRVCGMGGRGGAPGARPIEVPHAASQEGARLLVVVALGLGLGLGLGLRVRVKVRVS